MSIQNLLLPAALTIFLSMQTACVSNTRWAGPADFTLRISDNRDMKRFELAFSPKNQTLCLSREQWPNAAGRVAGHATLSSGSHRVEASQEDFGYCPGGCGEHRVVPGGTLNGYIEYGAFGDAQAVADYPDKQLSFSVNPYLCM